MATLSVNGKPLEKVTITCADCGTEFDMYPAEQKFYLGKGFEMPKTCPNCRAAEALGWHAAHVPVGTSFMDVIDNYLTEHK